MCEIKVTEKPIDLSDENGMQVLYKQRFTDRKEFVDLLQNVIGQFIVYIHIYSTKSYLHFHQLNQSSDTRKVT